MITVSVSDLIGDQEIDLRGDYGLYVIRDDDVFFYIGRTKMHPSFRLMQHLGAGGIYGRRTSQLGDFLVMNHPESYFWQVDLLDISDCEPYLLSYALSDKEAAALLARRYQSYDNSDVAFELLERTLISCIGTCLNRAYNHLNRREMPERYKGHYGDNIAFDDVAIRRGL
jgi:hypothetical protein